MLASVALAKINLILLGGPRVKRGVGEYQSAKALISLSHGASLELGGASDEHAAAQKEIQTRSKPDHGPRTGVNPSASSERIPAHLSPSALKTGSGADSWQVQNRWAVTTGDYRRCPKGEYGILLEHPKVTNPTALSAGADPLDKI